MKTVKHNQRYLDYWEARSRRFWSVCQVEPLGRNLAQMSRPLIKLPESC